MKFADLSRAAVAWAVPARFGITVLLLGTLLVQLPARATDFPVTNAVDIALAALQAKPGDNLIMRDGVWTNADIIFSAQGTATQPITLRAQTLGRVHLTGQSRLRLSGNYLVVDGLTFTNGYRTSGDVIAFQNTSSTVANNSRLTDCAIVDYNPPDGRSDTKWVSLYGLSNRVDNCYFRGKTNVGTTLVVWVDQQPDRPNYHRIDQNYFAYRPPLGTNGSNGGESIRVGTSDVSLNLSRTLVENNYFEQCNGDVEIVSSKSCENVYRHNTFVDCEGALTLRHGNRCVVEGNYFFGHNKPLTGGVRIVGDDHTVYNNYFQDLLGTSSRAPLTLMQGLEGTPLNGYYQVHRARVLFNTFVNCTNTMLLGLSGTITLAETDTTVATTLPPVDCIIANNIVVQAAGKIVDERIANNTVWESNLMHGATLGITTNSGTLRLNPQLGTNGPFGLWRPTNGSPALGNARTGYTFVTNDFEGHLRPGAPDIGADQASISPPLYPPLTATNVGPLFMRLRGTFLMWPTPADIAYGTPLSALQLNASANAAGVFAYQPPAGTLLNVGTGQVLKVVFTPTDLLSFSVATQTVAINVIKATPTVTWTNPVPITYGTPLGAAQLNAIANVPGTFLYTPPLGTVLNASNGQTLTLTFTPTDANNYVNVSRTVAINVAKVTPVITWANPAAIAHGTLLSAAQLNAAVNAPGTLVYTPPLGTVLAAGSDQPLTVTFTPNDPANYNAVSRTVLINVTVGGKTVPSINWPAPAPILFGTALSGLQLNATASVPGTLTYSPPAGTILPAGLARTLSVTFIPNDTLTYTNAVKTVPIDVALMPSNALVRVAYLVPNNRVAQAHAVATLRHSLLLYQKWFADQMERNGFGRKTFVFETEPDRVTPFVHVLTVPKSDSFLRGDLYGNRVLEAARDLGLPVGGPGQVWWFIPETHLQQPDGSLVGSFDGGYQLPGPIGSSEAGWALSGSDDLAFHQPIYQTNAQPYAGYIVPQIGPYPLAQDVSFPWFQGISLSGISSSVVGAGLRSLGQAFGLDADYRNDENFNGNVMGFGFSGIRGVFYPERFPYNYCGLSYASALALSVSPFFNQQRLLTDFTAPALSVTTSGTRTPVEGMLRITFNASDDQGLHAALLKWGSGSDGVMAAEMSLAGPAVVGATFAVPYFTAGQTNHYTVTIFDRQGNRRSVETSIVPTATVNHSPEPFLRITPLVVGLGEDVVLDASETFDPEHGVGLLEVEWDLDGDGFFDTVPTTELVYTTSYTNLGSRLIRARVTDPAGDVAVSAPVAVSVTVCMTGLSPTTRSHGYGYSTGTVTVTSGPKCLWTVVNTNDWITILPERELVSSGKWKLKYYTEPNPFFVPRTGTMWIGDQLYTVVQDATLCTYSLSPTNRFHGFGTGSNTFAVSTKTNCTWTALNTNSWITIISGSRTNSGNVNYTLTENRVTGRRSGNITVNDEVFTVTQWGTNCETVISPYVRSHSVNSETALVTVSVPGGCAWTVLNTNLWISMAAQSGTGSSNLAYTIAANPSVTPRSGVVLVNNQPFTITQQACEYDIAPLSRAHGYGGTNGTVNVTAGAVCSWSVSNTNDWIVISSATQGTGSGSVNYVITTNPRGEARSGRFTVAGIEFEITQDGQPCGYDIDPTEYGHTEEADFGEVFVFAEPGCAWTVENPVPWITILAGASGDGPGSVVYYVEANTGPTRSTTLTVAGQDYTVTQPSGLRHLTAGSTSVASGQTNKITVTLDAHGSENNLAFSLCFDTNLLSFVSAKLGASAPLQAVLSTSNDPAQGRVGFTVAMPAGWSMPVGTGTTVEVSFRAAAGLNGNVTTPVSLCDTPVPRRLVDVLGHSLGGAFENGSVRVIGFCTLAEAVDAPQLNWVTNAGPAGPWICQSTNTHDLDDAAVSGVTPDSGESYMQTTVVGPGTLSFWWKVSSESGQDFLRFSMGGSSQFQISGEMPDWEWRTFNVPSGSRVLRWAYRKNSSGSAGRDRGWVDQIVYDPSPPSFSSQPVGQAVDAGSTVSFNVSVVGQTPLSYQWLFNNVALADGGSISGARTATLTLANVRPAQRGLPAGAAQGGTYAVVVGNAQGNITSSNAVLNVQPLIPLPDALEAMSLAWTTNGTDRAWVGQIALSHDGVDAARSGTITHSQKASFRTVVNGPGTVRFWWKVSSEVNDKLTFYVNGSSQGSIGGEVDWQQKTFAIGSGAQTLLWTYAKDSSTSGGQDRAWVDQFEFFPSPVSITAQPQSRLVDQGSNAVFTVGVSGAPPVTYQWQFTAPGGVPTDLVGATNATLTVSNAQLPMAGQYAVRVSNPVSSVLSANASLQVNLLVPLAEAVDATNFVWVLTGTPSGTAPWVGQAAVSRDGEDAARSGRITDNQNTSFQTTVTGPGTVSFWWKVSTDGSDRLRFYVNGTEVQNITGEVDWTWRTFAVGSGSQLLEWRFTKGSSGAAGQDSGWVDQIHYVPNNTPTAPFMVLQPTNRTVVATGNVSFIGVAGGSTPLSYQWYFTPFGGAQAAPLANGGGVSGATTTNLLLTSAGAAQGGAYSLVASNAAGSITSSVAALTVISAPVITTQPVGANVLAGSTVVFRVGAIGLAPLSYQWMFNGTPLVNGGKVSGATTTNLTLSNVQVAEQGIYSVMVSNAAGVVTSLESGTLVTWNAARTPATGHGESTALRATVTGPGTIKFSWKVSSETNSDWFQFLIGTNEQERISGEVDWRNELFPVPEGVQTLQWSYTKDGSGTAGQDAGYLDAVEFSRDVLTPPVFSGGSATRTVGTGGTILLEAVVSPASAGLTYQWWLNGLPLPDGSGVSGAKTPRLTLMGVQAAQAGSYTVVASNVFGSVTGSVASLIVTSAPIVTVGAPVITTPPASRMVSENTGASFNVTAAGTPPLTYRWQFNGTNLNDGNGVSGATTSILSLSNVPPSRIGNYSVVVSNALGVTTSASASLTVLTLAESIGAPYLTLSRAGFPSWAAQTSVTHDLINAATSGVTPDGTNSRLETWVDGPGTVTFWWKVSSESVNDDIRFVIGATEMARISGEVNWQQQSFNVPSGSQILMKWRYGKNASGAAGQDAAWLDDVQYVFTGGSTAPAITNQPVSQSVLGGATVTFNSGASGSLPLSYQWRLNGTNIQNGGGISGAKTPRLTLAGVQSAQAGSYSLFVSNAAGNVSSFAANLAVTPVFAAPIFSSHPASQIVNEGVPVSFHASATGAQPLSYQWQLNGANIIDGNGVSGATTPSLTLSNAQANRVGNYSLMASNSAGVVTSASASLTLLPFSEVAGAPYLNFSVVGNASWLVQNGQTFQTESTNDGAQLTVSTPPSITVQPASMAAIVGNDVNFMVGVSGSPELFIQWRFNGAPLVDGGGINGATGATLTLNDIRATNAGAYSVVVSNAVGVAISSNALLTALTPPSVTTVPASQTVAEGATAVFQVVAAGTSPLTYRWRRNGTNLANGANVSGATTATLALNNAQPVQAGAYSVEINGPGGTVVSADAQLTVLAAMTQGESVNAPYLEWNTDESIPWTVQTNVTHDGEAAARSGNITHGDSTWIETTLTGPGTLRFWWKVSSQTNADFLTFSVNGANWAQISGEVNWQRMTYNLPAGSIVLRWTYAKDATGTNGLDRGWLDEVDFVPTVGPSFPVIIREPLGQDIDPGTTVTLSVEALGSGPLSYQWRFEGQNMSDGANVLGAKSPTLTLFNILDGQAGAYDVVVRNPYSLDVSERVFVNVIPVVSLPAAMDTDSTNLFNWTTGGFSPWRGQTEFSVDRIDSAQSGPLPNTSSNWIQTVISGPGAISFWWKCSSETNHDRLRFLVNGVEQANLTGEVDWRLRTFPIDLPNSTLRWVYTKDATGNAGLDRAWVDVVNFGPSAPVITNLTTSGVFADQGTTVKLGIDASGTGPFSYQWQFRPDAFSNWTNLIDSPTNSPIPGQLIGATGNRRLTISNAQPSQSGMYIGTVFNQAGIAISEPIPVQIIPALPAGPALNTNLVWETYGDSWWVGTTNVTHDGVMAARNGTLANAKSTFLRTTVTGPGTLTFWWKASTETNADILTFSIDGSEMARISGNQNWQQRTYDLLDGSFALEWEYNKNALATNGLDQVYLDEVNFAPIGPIITNSPASRTVDQGSTVTFTAGVRGTPPLTYQWLFNGLPLANGGNISGADTVTLRITGVQPAQAGVYSLRVINSVGTATSGSAVLSVLPTFPLAEALDTTGFTWTTSSSPSGLSPWVGQATVTHDGVDAARSPALTDSQTATVQTTLAGPGTVSFWWRVSSQTNGDYLIFYAGSSGSTEQGRISGETGWRQFTTNLASGNHTLRWTYSKNGSVTNGQDRAWVDQFVFTAVPPSITSQPASQMVDQGTTAALTVAASGTPPFSYQWRLNGVPLADGGGISGATTATLSVANVQPSQGGAYSVVVGNAGGNATSASAVLSVATLLPLDVALDGDGLVWTTSGSPVWVGQTGVSHDGVDAARIAGVAASGSASMQATVVGPGTISFWWKVSSEPNNDRLIFYTNNTAVATNSGEVDWLRKSFDLSAGSQILKWTYLKNSGSTTGGQDRAWVDEVAFGAVPPVITGQPTNQNVDAGATASFKVTAGGTPPLSYQWQFNGVDLANGGGVSGATSSNLVLTGAQTSQAGSYRVLVTNPAGTIPSANAALAVFPILTLEEALDAGGLLWATNGTPPWVGHGAVTHDGTDAARSGAIGASGVTSMTTILNGPVTVSFWWKVSSEPSNDKLVFSTNGAAAATISGEVDWQFKSVNLGAGSQTLTWTYSKNSGSTIGGQDRGWVDQMQFGIIAPVITAQPANAVASAGSAATFTVGAAGTPTLFYRWLFNGFPLSDGPGIGGATTATLTVSNVQPFRVGNYSATVSNSAGTQTSAEASLALTVPSTNVSLNEALDGGLDFTTGGTASPWTGQTGISHDFSDAAQSGPGGDVSYTWIKTTITGPRPLTFWWKVSSEEDHDYLKFMVDGVELIKISGEVPWQQIVTNIPSGTHEVQWRYSRNSALAAGQDRGWVDQIYLGTNTPPVIEPPSILIQPSSQSVDADDTVHISVGALGSPPLTYQWFKDGLTVQNGGNVTGATTSELTLVNVLESQAGNYYAVVGNAAGTVSSMSARLTVLPVLDLADAVDAPELFILTDGAAPWVGHSVLTHDGTDAGRSGIIGGGQSSVMETMINGPANLSFWWKVSSETNADLLTFSVNGAVQGTISGEVGWRQHSIALPSGPQLLEWSYTKNGSVASGADRGWVDQISFQYPGAPNAVTVPSTGAMTSRISVESNIAQITWQGDAEKTYKVFYKNNLADAEWTLLEGEVRITWQEVDGNMVPNVITATTEDVLAGQMRFYRVLEY